MRYLISSNQIPQNLKYLNQIQLPALTDPLQIECLYINCISQRDLANVPLLSTHKHTYYEFHFPINQEVRYAFENGIETVQSNQFIVIQPNVEHSIIEPHPSLVKFGFGIMFSSPSLDPTLELKSTLSRNTYSIGTQTEKIKLCFKGITKECAEPNIFSPYAIRDLIIQILLEIGMLLDKKLPKLHKNTDASNDNRITIIKQFINDNMNKPLDTAAVANYLHISMKQLNRIFYKAEGISVSKYISSLKINEAIRLLSTTDLSIKEISILLGFEHEKAFGAFFKKLTQLSPSKFRKSHPKYTNGN